MKRKLIKTISVILALMMTLAMVSACGSTPEKTVEEPVEETVVPAAKVTIEADGKEITIEDTEGKTVSQLIEEAGIKLNDGDVISFDPAYVLGEDLTIRILRKANVVVVVAGEDPLDDLQYTAVLVGGTVKDAIEAVVVRVPAVAAAPAAAAVPVQVQVPAPAVAPVIPAAEELL